MEFWFKARNEEAVFCWEWWLGFVVWYLLPVRSVVFVVGAIAEIIENFGYDEDCYL